MFSEHDATGGVRNQQQAVENLCLMFVKHVRGYLSRGDPPCPCYKRSKTRQTMLGVVVEGQWKQMFAHHLRGPRGTRRHLPCTNTQVKRPLRGMNIRPQYGNAAEYRCGGKGKFALGIHISSVTAADNHACVNPDFGLLGNRTHDRGPLPPPRPGVMKPQPRSHPHQLRMPGFQRRQMFAPTRDSCNIMPHDPATPWTTHPGRSPRSVAGCRGAIVLCRQVADGRQEETENISLVQETKKRLGDAHLRVPALQRGFFSDIITNKLGRYSRQAIILKHKDQDPVSSVPYRVSPPKMKILKNIISGLEWEDVVEIYNSNFSSPSFLLPKKTPGKFRVISDHRKVIK
ncbi:hypothetical protein PR048_014321 [Dryococelus australis]|uniref:Uncharacterized protein n=1 Tax=Dryococelus australis TaxID=614101 RepID=A0ABQ9HDU4_9NEOP|nr:hypothetical protein PR048_014321 [Dryococelus australis]